MNQEIKDLKKENTILQKKIEEQEIKLLQLQSENSLYFENTKLFHYGPVVVFKWANIQGRPVEYVSPNVKNVLGYTWEDFRKDQGLYIKMIHEDDKTRVQEEVKKNLDKDGEYFTHQPYRLIGKDQKEVLVYDYTTIYKDKKGEITHMIGCIIDISFNKNRYPN